MANRYLNLFKLPERLYAKGSPIIIEAGALHKDSVLGDVVAQLKFRSIVKKQISSLTAEITCYNAAKEIINPTFIYKYENIIVNENEQFFGSKTLITLPNNDTRSFSVKITNVEFSDGSAVIITENEWKSIPKQNDLSSFDNVFVEYFRKKYGFTEFLGDNVEYHPSGCITFPILGTKAIQEDKLAFDPDRSKRRAIYNEVSEAFPDYNVFVGGSSSFDMSPKPYNKYYALDLYCKENNIPHDCVVYIGDDYGLGGNDECVYKADFNYLKIDDYRDFMEIIKVLL
jgi:hypothetical protein